MDPAKQTPSTLRRRARAARQKARQVMSRVTARLKRPNVFRLSTPERIGVVYTAPSDMRIDERMFLYSFVRGFQPERVLEVGVLHGGGGCIMANAMEENGRGMVIGIDPNPQLRVSPADVHGRYTVISKPSPAAIDEAREKAGGPFDFALIDGLHMFDQVRQDIRGVLPHMKDGAYILFHDAFHYGVSAAIGEAVKSTPELHDCGYPCRTAQMFDPLTPYNGFRLLRYAANPIANSAEVAAPLYQAAGKPLPEPSDDVLNHDVWFCRVFNPCPKCRANGVTPKGTG